MKNIVSLLEYILALFLVLNCRSVYQHIVDRDYHINEILVIILILLLVIKILLRNYDKNKLSTALIFLSIYCFFITFFVLLNNISDQIKGFLINFGIIFPSLYFYYYIDKDSKNAIICILRKISNIMVFLSIMSLVLYLIGPILKLINSTGSIYVSWGDKNIPTYYDLHFVTQSTNFFGTKLLRNTGIFVEAPMYNLNLTIALAIELFILDKRSVFKKSILLITILTTISTTGIIIAIIMLIIKGIITIKDRLFTKNVNTRNLIKYFVFPILIIMSLVIIINILDDKKQSKSWSVRIDDYKACYEAWKNNIFFGNGYGNEESIQKYMSSFRGEGLSNSIMVLLAQCGIYMFIFYMVPVYKLFLYGIKKNNVKISIFVLIMLLLFITTIFTYTAMIINFLAIGYTLITSKRNNNQEGIKVLPIADSNNT